MGCQISVSIRDSQPSFRSLGVTKPSKGQIFPSGIILPTTTGLESMLQQAHLREHMRRVISKSWLTAGTIRPEALPSYTSNDGFAAASEPVSISNLQAQAVAISCIDMWADVNDLRNIPESAFKDYRVSRIYEKYIMFGATHKVLSI